MPYNQFAPCNVSGCEEPRAKRRAWCAEHVVVIDSAKDRNRCDGSARAKDRIEKCFLVRGHVGPCRPRLEVLRDVVNRLGY